MKMLSGLVMMGGWKTWTAAAGLALLAVVDVANGDFAAAGTKFVAALGMIGLGDKIEKAGSDPGNHG